MARSKISLIVAPRPLLPEEAEANQAPLMLVGPERSSRARTSEDGLKHAATHAHKRLAMR